MCEINPKHRNTFILEMFTSANISEDQWRKLVLDSLTTIEQSLNASGEIRVHIHDAPPARKARVKKRKIIKPPSWRIAVHRRHPSGIGSIFVRHELSFVKPEFDKGFWMDETNKEWARWE